ncbi:unnamed protein product [Darwinula stevensoni]|uniref:Uncharacterized protein n=1 Tax=Darwinula stevensoni TaxID=69355 RepID=A0A7R9FPB2_9CRUS|nr:unnamed protein product [Darwinula stevensoni]CAG0897369.1 unnamed protein product [Darwinula stevensoni]
MHVSSDFTLLENEAVEEFPPGVFGNVSLERIILLHTQVGSIHRSALRSSKEQLRRPEILAGELREFPWDFLPDMPGLVHLELGENFLLDLPPVESPSLERLSLGGNKIARLTVGWSTPNLTALVVGECHRLGLNEFVDILRSSAGFHRRRVKELVRPNFTKESFVLMLENLAAGEGYIDLYGLWGANVSQNRSFVHYLGRKMVFESKTSDEEGFGSGSAPALLGRSPGTLLGARQLHLRRIRRRGDEAFSDSSGRGHLARFGHQIRSAREGVPAQMQAEGSPRLGSQTTIPSSAEGVRFTTDSEPRVDTRYPPSSWSMLPPHGTRP